jgi:hypothetical protein
MADGVEFKELDKLSANLSKVLEEFPQKKRNLHESAADIMHRNVIRNIDAETKKFTGNLRKGQTKAVGSGGGYAAVRPNYSIAPHTHLVESGHKEYDFHGNPTGGYVNGKHMYQKALVQSESELIKAAEKFADEIVGAFL